MKKLIALTMIIAMVFAMAIPVMANPGQNPNQNPGKPEMADGEITITVTGGGNNLVILAILNKNGLAHPIPRAGNGTFTQTFTAFDNHYAGTIQVQGNSLKHVEVTKLPCEYDDWYTVKEATCTEEGLERCDCKNKYCDDFKTRPIPKLPCNCDDSINIPVDVIVVKGHANVNDLTIILRGKNDEVIATYNGTFLQSESNDIIVRDVGGYTVEVTLDNRGGGPAGTTLATGRVIARP